MVTSVSASAGGLSSGFFAQIQRQQAERDADQAQQKARALQAQAQSAQEVANRAQESARNLKVQAGQAHDDAASARQGLVAMDSIGEIQTQLSGLREQIDSVLTTGALAVNKPAASTTDSSAALPAVVNTLGQQTGTVVNVTA